MNHAGHQPEWIYHATWDGLHLADVVMPSFLLLVGLSAVLSLSSARQKGVPRGALMRKALSRAGGVLFYLLHSCCMHDITSHVAACSGLGGAMCMRESGCNHRWSQGKALRERYVHAQAGWCCWGCSYRAALPQRASRPGTCLGCATLGCGVLLIMFPCMQPLALGP